MRKTIRISELKEKTNKLLAESKPEAIEGRKAVARFVMDILHETGNYKGFGYLESESDIHVGFYGKDCRIVIY